MVIVRCIFIVIVIGVLMSTIKYSISVTSPPSMYFHSAYIPTCKEYPFLMWKKRSLNFLYFRVLGNIFPCSWNIFHVLGNIFLCSWNIFPCSWKCISIHLEIYFLMWKKWYQFSYFHVHRSLVPAVSCYEIPPLVSFHLFHPQLTYISRWLNITTKFKQL